MRRRSFLWVAGAAAISSDWKGAAQDSLGTLAWAEAGSLWTRELPDGRAVMLATGEALREPRFSASGRWISYRAGEGKIYVVRSDGHERALIAGDGSTWFPREDRLAVAREGGSVCLAADSVWKKEQPLPPESGLPVFAPDGERFVCGRDWRSPTAKEDDSPTGQLCLASAAAPGRGPDVLVSNEEGGVAPYAWTRDGNSILYWSADEWSASLWCDGVGLFSVTPGGGQPHNLNLTTLVHDEFLDLAPSPAGNRLAATRGEGRNTWEDQKIALLDLDTGFSRNLTADGVAAQMPAWSPDGRSIAYVAAPDARAAYLKTMTGVNIRIMRPDGSIETKPVTPEMKIGIGGGEEAHVFLQQRKIWLIDPGGEAKPRQITGDARYRDEAPAWSRTGEHILFGRMDYDGHASLWLMEADGENAAQVCKLQISGEFDQQDDWFGYYGYIDWRSAFDWRR